MFDGTSDPNALQATVTGLTTHKYYKFRVFAVDFNGFSDSSEIFEIYACGLPRDFGVPRYVASDQLTITLEWDTPSQDGGCPIYDYSVERDLDGTGQGPWTEVNPLGTYPRDDPYLTQHTCDMFPPGTPIGSPFVFRVTAFNTQGSVQSIVSAQMFLASVPDKPDNAPTSDWDVTSRTQIKVDYEVVDGDGGLPLLGYEL